MIITKNWLNEFLDVSELSIDKIAQTLNSIGLEVDSINKVSIPSKVVVAKVLECEKHPDADKLNVCQVDIGGEVKQIVCGAKNVATGQIVVAAVVGADLGNNFIIKEAKLRGVDSHGMICGSNEIGLPKTNDGILVLDNSIGELELGKELCSYDSLNDTVIEIELTANRGDCLSIYGVARDLSAALDIPLRESSLDFNITQSNAINISHDNDTLSVLSYQSVDTLCTTSNTLIDLRVGFVDEYVENEIERLLAYTTQATGVLLRAYAINPNEIDIQKDENGLDCVICDNKVLSIIGVNQSKEFRLSGIEKQFLLEASYINPDIISRAVMGLKIEKDDLYYRSSRGSEPNLEFGLGYFANLIGKNSVDISKVGMVDKYSTTIDISFDRIDNFIGQDIDHSKVVNILKKLRFDVYEKDNGIEIKVPTFRHDISHDQDIIEEIVRVVGIDNIVSTPFSFAEKNRINNSYRSYKKRNHFRAKAAARGYFEAVHYFFDSKEKMQGYNLESIPSNLDLLNPITKELNTLRSTLLLHLLNSASRNLKHGKKSVKLFEVGKVVNKNRDEFSRISFIWSGDKDIASISNHGKPSEIDFMSFASDISAVVGDIKLEVGDDNNSLVNPYEYARVLINGEDVGFIARVHVDVESDYDLPSTYICEVDFDKLIYEKVIACDYSKFPSLSRDLSFVIPKNMKFKEIRDYLNSVLPSEVIGVYPIDLYESEDLGDNMSLTIKFILQSKDKTLKESDITSIMTTIMEGLKNDMNVGIR